MKLHMKLIIFFTNCIIFSANVLWSMDATKVIDQNIPKYDQSAENTLLFCGSRDPHTGSLKADLLRNLRKIFNLEVFVESGTFQGSTTEVAKNIFPEVHTIELSINYFINACNRFQSSENVYVHNGDSGAVLNEILPNIKNRILFYLDGHYSGGNTALADTNTPIIKELKAIKETHKENSIILIDDIRLFQTSLYADKIKNTCLEGYPDLRSIVEILVDINPTYQICFLGDALLAYPNDEKVSVSHVMRACAIERLSISFPEFPESALDTSIDIISQATWSERNELVIYFDTFSDFELSNGFTSFSTLYYALILMHDEDLESAIKLINLAIQHSVPRHCLEHALKKAIIQLEPYNNTSTVFTTDVLNLYQKSFSFVTANLNQEELELYQNDKDYLAQFPLTLYHPIFVPTQGTFFINDIDDSIKNQLRTQTPWEKTNQNIIERYVKPGTLALDIGSHIGTHTVTMSKCVGENGSVFAFEPSKLIFRELCYNLAINDCTNVYALRSAIGKVKSMIEVVCSHPRNEGGSYVVDLKNGENAAILLPLDAFNLNNISFIKIDVENMEADVLDGAKETIQRNRPVMLIEVQGNGERPYQLGENSAEMAVISLNKIKNLGYRLERIENGCDYLAIPKESEYQ